MSFKIYEEQLKDKANVYFILIFFLVKDEAFHCTSWPKSSNYGCVNEAGDDWTLLDETTFGTSECKSLCLQHASGDGCCYYVGYNYGCYWKAGSSAIPGAYGFAITCVSKVPGEFYLIL